MDRKPLNVPLWQKESGNALTHSQGLTAEQVEAIKLLKAGDRLILFLNKKAGETQPTFNLKVFNKPQESSDSGGL